MSKPRLEGKVALITGAASGIGEAAARLFVENGASVVIADVQDDLGREVTASIGSKASYIHCDVRKEDQVEAAVKFAVEKHGTLDIMYSNAGVMGSLSGILEFDLDAFENTIAVNLKGAASCIKHAARVMVEQKKKGSIICTSSVTAKIGGLGPPAYTASKHGLMGLVKSACSGLGPYGIRVNSVSPFGVATPLACESYSVEPAVMESLISHSGNLKGVVLKAEHIAQAALFLASDESVYVSGHDLAVDGGITVVGPQSNQSPEI